MSSPKLIFKIFFIIAIQTVVRLYLTVFLIYVSLIIGNVEIASFLKTEKTMFRSSHKYNYFLHDH